MIASSWYLLYLKPIYLQCCVHIYIYIIIGSLKRVDCGSPSVEQLYILAQESSCGEPEALEAKLEN